MLLAYPFINLDLQDKDGNTPLHIACMKGTSDIIELLVKAKSNTEIQNKRKKRPIELCKHEDNKKIISQYKQGIGRNSSPGKNGYFM